MEDHNTNIGNKSSQQNNKSVKETMRSGTPDEVHDRVKAAVEKGVAAVAGALQGFNERTESSKLPETAKGAIHQAAETAKTTVSSVTDEIQGLKEPMRDAGHKLSETAKGIRSSVQDQVHQTKDAMSGSGSSGSSSSGSRYSPTDESPGMGMGGSALGGSSSSSSPKVSDMPDISDTPMAQSDKKLQGKDLTSLYDE